MNTYELTIALSVASLVLSTLVCACACFTPPPQARRRGAPTPLFGRR